MDGLDSDEEADDMPSALPAVPDRDMPWLSNPLSCNPVFDDNEVSRPASVQVAGAHWASTLSVLRASH